MPRALFRGLFGSALALAAGCQSYRIIQENVFSDEDGQIVRIEYGHSDSDHTNHFISPVTGEEMEYNSKLMIRAHLPDLTRCRKYRATDGKIRRSIERLSKADDFVAWQCMNFLPSGTMYMTDDTVWKVLVNGFSVNAFLKEKDGRYREVYRGVLCDSPGGVAEKDDRWRDVKPQQKNYKAK